MTNVAPDRPTDFFTARPTTGPAPGAAFLGRPRPLRSAGGRCSGGGFTLVELMIVVVIIGILAALSVVGYRRWAAKGRVSEVVAMLGVIQGREELYRQEFAMYLPARADVTVLTSPSINGDEAAAAFYPVAANALGIGTATRATPLPTGLVEWKALGITPRSDYLFCTYMANAGNGNSTAGPPPVDTINTAATFGKQVFPAATYPAPWYVALGVCNLTGNDNDAYPGGTSIFMLSSLKPQLMTFNDGF